MPSIIAYETVLAQMQEQNLRCQYYNSGAFGFDADVTTYFTGWIGPPDSTIRSAALEHARHIAPPYGQTLARLATQAWRDLFPGPAWVMPKSSWAFELDFGSKVWLPDALRTAGVDPALLAGRTDAPAIEFSLQEADRFTPLVQMLLDNLLASDFALGFPGHPIACMLHHRKHIWWISSDPGRIQELEAMAVMSGQ